MDTNKDSEKKDDIEKEHEKEQIDHEKKDVKTKEKTTSIDMSKILFVILGIGILFSIYFFLADGDTGYDESDEVLANLAVECEEGAWVTFPIDKKLSKKFTGETTFQGVISHAGLGDDEMTDEQGDMIITTHPEYSLVFYNGREVEIEGNDVTSSDGNHLYVHKIRCTGAEAETGVKAQRQALMRHIQSNQQSLFEMSGYSGEITIDDIAFVNDNNDNVVYVTFIQEGENKTDVIMLMEFEKTGDGYSEKMLAQYEYDEEGRVLAQGKNPYSGERSISYEYDEDLGEWILAW